MFQPPHYPVVQFLLRWGSGLAILIALLPVAVAAVWCGAAWWIAAIGLVVGIILWLFVKSYVEVLSIIADTLLPK